jgi:beta-phosphoglucomutase-like phosphatase (HAD superfamily)
MIKRLAIFDFDGTLKDTHDNVNPNFMSELRFSENPEEIRAYARRSIDWLTSIESISRTEGGDPWIDPVVTAARRAIDDPETLAVLMTARNPGAKDLIVGLLASEVGLAFDIVLFKTNDMDPETGKYISEDPATWKARKTLDLIQREPTIEHIDVFEDSEENLRAIGVIIPEEITYDPHLESTRRGARLARKAAHKASLDNLNRQRKEFYSHRGIDIASVTKSLKEWREAGDSPLPSGFNKGAPKKKKAPYDATYGNEPDLLDKPGVIVEPDVRKKISNYFTKMKLREFIRDCLK